MRIRMLAVVLPLVVLVVCACAKKEDVWIPKRPHTADKVEKKTRRALHQGAPKIGGQAVRDWFARVSFPGYRRLSIFSEFHPDEGSFVARYGKKDRILYLSYIDNQRMSQFGLARSAKEILETGRAGLPQSISIQGRTWYGVNAEQPLLAVDVSGDVKLVLMGYQGLKLDDLRKLAESVPVEILERQAGESG